MHSLMLSANIRQRALQAQSRASVAGCHIPVCILFMHFSAVQVMSEKGYGKHGTYFREGTFTFPLGYR